MDVQNLADFSQMALKDIIPSKREKFITIYNDKFGSGGEAFYEEQLGLFNNELENGNYTAMLQQATHASIFNSFLFLCMTGLSLEKCLTTLCYLECKSIKNKVTDRYIKYAVISVTGYGEVVLRKRAGQIAGIENPVVVYQNDDFRMGEKDGKKYINYEACFPRDPSARILGCYVKIIKNLHGDYDYFFMDNLGIQRLADYSKKANGGKYANGLYTSNYGQIDTGFLISKTIKHAFKGYPKLNLGAGGELEADKDVEIQKTAPQGVKIDTDDDDNF